MGKTNLTLAITTIGDLLLNNKITTGKNNKPIENVYLKIPDYQRPYKWTPKNAMQLFDDIAEAKAGNKDVYRVGTLILHREIKRENVLYNIVDGQQRTITFALLLTALREDKIDFLDMELPGNIHTIRNIPNNLTAFKRRLEAPVNDYEKNRENEELKAFILNRCEMIVVITDDISEAFQFFDSQNARGKTLYPHDLLKAYHLREMSDIDEIRTEKIVKEWEENKQEQLASLFGDYLYRIKEWIAGNRALKLDESNINIFKGVTRKDRTPYAQFYKAAFAYAEMVNNSAMPFVTGTRNIGPFQIDAPIVAGKPFFDYTVHYFSILKDIQDNSKYEGFYINDNEIVKTLDKYYKKRGTGFRITRLMFDTAVLLYVDRFCPASFPDKTDLKMFDRFVEYAFIWAYSLRAQYERLSWHYAQNYILSEGSGKAVTNSFNMYRLISHSDSPSSLLSALADTINPITLNEETIKKINDKADTDGVFADYLYYFRKFNFLNGQEQ